MLRRVNHNQVRSELRSKGAGRADKQTNKQKHAHTHTRVYHKGFSSPPRKLRGMGYNSDSTSFQDDLRPASDSFKNIMSKSENYLKKKDENNTFYEWIVPDKPMKPFVDLDGKYIDMFGDCGDLQFTKKYKEILNALFSIPNVSILSSSNPIYIPEKKNIVGGNLVIVLHFII